MMSTPRARYRYNRKLNSEYSKLEKRKREFWKMATEDVDELEEPDVLA